MLPLNTTAAFERRIELKFIRYAMPVIAIFAIAGQGAADTTPVRYLMTVEGINTNPFQVQAFSWGVSNPVSIGVGGITTGRPSVSSFNIMKSFDSSDPALLDACFHGMTLANARVRGYRGTNTVPFLDIYMETVFVESHQMSAAANVMPTCSVSFAFEKLTINGVVLDPTTLALNPQILNNMVASITQKALAVTPTPAKTKKKITVR